LTDETPAFETGFEALEKSILPQEKQDAGPSCSRLDNAIHRINHYPVDTCKQNKPRYPLDSDLSGG